MALIKGFKALVFLLLLALGVYYVSYRDKLKTSSDIISESFSDTDFQTLESVRDFVKDANNVFYRNGDAISGPDAPSFEFLGRAFYRDKNNVFVARGPYGSNKILEIVRRDSATFQLLPPGQVWQSGYSKDKDGVYYDPDQYYEGVPIAGADPVTFTVLTGTLDTTSSFPNDVVYTYAIDSKEAYFNGKIVEGADFVTLQVIENGQFTHLYAKDKNGVYFETQTITNADPATFEVLWHQLYEGCGLGHYARDARNVYFGIRLAAGTDPATFKPLINDYGRDKNGIFLKGVLQTGVDPNTFIEPPCDYG